MKIPERTQSSIKGLNRMINWIEQYIDIEKSSICEIGSWTGLSAIEFSKKFQNVVCIDPWSPTEEINTEYNMDEVEAVFDSRTSNIENIMKIKAKAEDYALVNKVMFDVVYIDGIHNYDGVSRDISNYLPFAAKVICGHDYCSRFPGVMYAVDEKFGKPDAIFPDTSWVKIL